VHPREEIEGDSNSSRPHPFLISPEAKPEEGGRRSRAAGARGREDEDVRPVAGLLPPGVEAQLALSHGVRHHRLHHHQDDGQLHRGRPQELQVRPGTQEALTNRVSTPPPPPILDLGLLADAYMRCRWRQGDAARCFLDLLGIDDATGFIFGAFYGLA
jgi:hypothetical protein